MPKRISVKLGLLLLVTNFIFGMIFPGSNVAERQMGRIADLPDGYVNAVSQSSSVKALPWYLQKIQAEKAWQKTAGGNDVIVAVLDTGIDQNHEDLAGKVIASINFGPSQTVNDVNGHGTLISGIIAASFENMKSATGVAYNSRLLNVKVTGDNGFVTPEAVAEGIVWAADHGANVINLSLTLGKPSEKVEKAVQYAWHKGCVIVAAAGNSGGVKPVYPAAYPNVIAVAATDQNDRMARWSNHGDWVGVSAPGTDIYSTLPGDRYAYKSGTSFAVPLVSGEAALLFVVAEDSNKNGSVNDEVMQAILSDTDARPDGQNAGRINVEKAVQKILNE